MSDVSFAADGKTLNSNLAKHI